MKQYTFLFLFCFFLCIACCAQTTKDNEYYPSPETKKVVPAESEQYLSNYYNIKVGVKSGVSRGSVLMGPSVSTIRFSPQTGFNAVLFGSITGKHKPVGIQLELGFINKKSGWVVDYNDTLTEQVFDLRYLTLPVLVKYEFGRTTIKNKASIYMLSGVELNFLLDAKLHLQTKGQDYKTVFDEKKRVNFLEGSVVLGLGYSMPIWNDLFFVLEGRGGLGITNFNKGVVINSYVLRNMYGLINAGFALRL